jgi:SAM-dependent methyltransferase
MVDCKRPPNRGPSIVTLLGEDPKLWDTVFPEASLRAGYVYRLARQVGPRVLDVGCATGSLCGLLSRRGLETVGIDVNRKFVGEARAKDPGGTYFVGDMRSFRLRRKFDLVICLGTTFSYNLTNKAVRESLRNFRRHLSPGGRLVIDVLNAITFTGARPFRRRTQHVFRHQETKMTATIRHELDLKRQTLSEQVTWSGAQRGTRRDPAEALRLFFPQELAAYVEGAGFGDLKLMDDFGKSTTAFTGRRLIIVA